MLRSSCARLLPCNAWLLAQVRDYTFSPDSGQISVVKFDRFGLPALSESVVSVFALPAQDVLRVEFTRVLVRSSPQISKETDGLLDRATEALFNIGVRVFSILHTGRPRRIWLTFSRAGGRRGR